MKVSVFIEEFGGTVQDVEVFESRIDAEAHWYEYWGTNDDEVIEELVARGDKESGKLYLDVAVREENEAMKLGEKEVTIKVRTVPLKASVLRQLPWRHYLAPSEKEEFKPVCWFNGTSIGLTLVPVILGTFHGTPILYSPGAVQRNDANEVTWGKFGADAPIPFAVIL